MMNCIHTTHTQVQYPYSHRVGYSYCLHKLLFSADALLFSEDTAYVHAITCLYLHSTVARLKITDCPNAPCPFYPRTGHMSLLQALTQSDESISFTPHKVPLTGGCRGLIFLISRFEIGLYKVRVYACTHSIIIRTVTLALVLWAFFMENSVRVTPPMLATCNRLYLWLSLNSRHLAFSSLRYTDCFNTNCLF